MENNQNPLKDLASCLKQAGEIVEKLNDDATSSSNSDALKSTTSSVSSVVDRARSLIKASSSKGCFSRLKGKERLRALNVAAPSKKAKPVDKTFEFVLVTYEDEEGDGESFVLEDDSIKLRGFVNLDSFMGEAQIRNRLEEAIQLKYPTVLGQDIEFMKAIRQKLTKPVASEFTFKEIKLLAGQGSLYIKIKGGFECLIEGEEKIHESKDDNPVDLKESISTNIQANPTEIPGNDDLYVLDPVHTSSCPTDQLVSSIAQKGLSDPVEILRFLQQELVKGRAMDAQSESEESSGKTNAICVDRQRILETTFTEFESIDDFNLTFEVDFMGEMARDLGGPRKEWIRLMNIEIKDKYFDKGLREQLSSDYYHVGTMIGIALLQNGQLPCYMPLDVIDNLITSTSDKCISNIQRGLDVFGLTKIMRKFPILLHLLRPSNHSLTPTIIIRLLKPSFSEEGTLDLYCINLSL